MEELNVIVVDKPLELMSMTAAEELTNAIKSTSQALHILLKEAHDKEAWRALGYSSWKAYVEDELGFTRSRSYQLIDQAKVIEEISTATGETVYITEKEARAIKKKLPEITEKIVSGMGEIEEGNAQEYVDEVVSSYVDSDEDYYKNSAHSYSDEDDEDANYGSELRKPAFNDDHEDYVKPAKVETKEHHQVDDSLSSEELFFVENYEMTLSIFDNMPTPADMYEMVNKSKDRDKLIEETNSLYFWLTSFLENENY